MLKTSIQNVILRKMDLLCLKSEMILRNMDLLNLTQILTVCGVPSAFPLGAASGTSNFYHSPNPWFLLHRASKLLSNKYLATDVRTVSKLPLFLTAMMLYHCQMIFANIRLLENRRTKGHTGRKMFSLARAKK